MIIDQEVEVLANANRLKYYQNLGYVCKYGDTIKVNVKHLTPKSGVKIDVLCDYCGKIYKSTKGYLARSKIKKDSCSDCRYKKIPECNMVTYGVTYTNKLPYFTNKRKATVIKKYGVDNVFKVPEFREKHKNTVLKEYGCENVFQNEGVKTKLKETNIEKYGVSNPMQNDAIVKKSRRNANKSLSKNNNVSCSKNQKHLSNLYKGSLNVLFTYYFVDIYFEKEKIYCEYDGSGHKLSVICNFVTEEEFAKKESIRYRYLKKEGLKMFKIKHEAKFLPSDKELLKIKDIAFELLLSTDNNWVEFDLDENIIKTKNFTKSITL